MPVLYVFCPNPGSTSFKGKEIWISHDTNGRITDYEEHAIPTQDNIPKGSYADAVRTAMEQRQEKRRPDIVGFKTVHAGPDFTGCYELDADVMAAMEKYTPLAPLHNPLFIDVIGISKKVIGEGPLYAGNFETAYARNMPRWARETCLPKTIAQRLGIERYGFHGNSHLYVSERAAQMLQATPKDFRIISVHVGGSSSVASRHRGIVIESSMGATPESTDIPMAARAGIYHEEMRYLMAAEGLNEKDAIRLITRESGLVGMSGKSYGEDLRRLYEDIDRGDEDVAHALKTFQYRLAREIGAQFMTMGGSMMGGIDIIVFTGGMSKSGRFIRNLCDECGAIKIELPRDLGTLEGDIKLKNEIPLVLKIETDEELVVAQACANLFNMGKHHTDSLFLKPV